MSRARSPAALSSDQAPCNSFGSRSSPTDAYRRYTSEVGSSMEPLASASTIFEAEEGSDGASVGADSPGSGGTSGPAVAAGVPGPVEAPAPADAPTPEGAVLGVWLHAATTTERASTRSRALG